MVCIKPMWRKIPGSKTDVPLPCGQCVVCKINKAREWAFRMTAESGYWPESAFLTLTYADDSVINLNKKDLQDAFKRARKGGLRFKYYACGEYGGENYRPHYHVCLFYDGDLGFTYDISYGKNNGHLIWWPHGITNLGTFSRESARYTADYLLKQIGDPIPMFLSEPFRLVSIGLAKQYLLDNRVAFENDGIRFGKSFIGVPRYYRKYMTIWLNEEGVPLSNIRFIKSLTGARLLERSHRRSEQRERNVVVRQNMYRKEF